MTFFAVSASRAVVVTIIVVANGASFAVMKPFKEKRGKWVGRVALGFWRVWSLSSRVFLCGITERVMR